MPQSTLYHTGAGTYQESTRYNGAAGTCGDTGAAATWRGTFAMQPLPDTADEIVSMVARLTGSVETEGPEAGADLYWDPGNGFLIDSSVTWPFGFPAPTPEVRSTATLSSSLPTVAQWNASGEVGIRPVGYAGRADRDGDWSTPTCVIDYYLSPVDGDIIAMFSLLPPLLLGPLATLLPREWGAVRALLARGVRGRGQHRFTGEEWARLVRAARAWRAPRRFLLA